MINAADQDRAEGWAAFAADFGVPKLDREQHDVDRTDFRRIIGDVGFWQMQIAVHALNLEAVPGNGVTVGAAGNEVNIVARRRHACAEISADGPRRHRRYTHDSKLQ